MEKNVKKEHIYIYKMESLYCTSEMNIILQINYISTKLKIKIN